MVNVLHLLQVQVVGLPILPTNCSIPIAILLPLVMLRSRIVLVLLTIEIMTNDVRHFWGMYYRGVYNNSKKMEHWIEFDPMQSLPTPHQVVRYLLHLHYLLNLRLWQAYGLFIVLWQVLHCCFIYSKYVYVSQW